MTLSCFCAPCLIVTVGWPVHSITSLELIRGDVLSMVSKVNVLELVDWVLIRVPMVILI